MEIECLHFILHRISRYESILLNINGVITQTDATGSSLAYHKIPPFIISICYIGGCHFSNVPLKMKFLRKMIHKRILGVI